MAAVQLPSTAVESCGKDEDLSDDFEETAFFSRGCCYFWNFPCCRSRKSDWERISTSEKEQQGSADRSWWRKGINAVKKVREWSELVAGPKWKTFIRRLNKTTGRSKPGKFQYDPMSYSLNFDEGPGRGSQFEDDRIFRDFSSRYAEIPVQSGQLKEVPPFT
ncbi:hypothetical protein CDL12_28012 [Handroanthus impetiginosus]|uniref:Uncharacterized protein n=1 Tax=Handroanthus impetiginosus TaxID=429701 RepID=A0A2G9G2F4_9LAMI|nr:hypothetical protein CDL12_28012 [Handroanthus impetiginosus]